MPSSWGRCGTTPPWATVGRVGSACSNARFTQRSRTDLFHVGSCWATNRRSRAAAPVGLDLRGVGDRLVVGAPLHDRRVVAERVDGLAGLAHGLPADLAGVAPLQREVLQQQHAELVGGAVQLVVGDVRLHAQHVEPGLDGQLDVAADLGRRGVGEARAGSAAGWRP